MILKLANLTRSRVKDLYPDQYAEIDQCLNRAFVHSENNSLLVLARSKQTMHNLISQVITDCSGQLAKDDPEHELKVVKVNATLLEANESKILM